MYIRILNWLFGAISLLNLIHELSWVRLFGTLKAWVMAYDNLVGVIHLYIFSWIHLGPIKISHIETNMLILYAIVTSATLNAFAISKMNGTCRLSWMKAFKESFGIFGLGLFYSLFFELYDGDSYHIPTIIIHGINLLLIVILLSLEKNEKSSVMRENSPSPMLFRKNILGISIVFLILLAINYGIFGVLSKNG